MKRYVMAFLVFLMLPFVVSANTANADTGISSISSTAKEVAVTVELDYSKVIVDGTKVAFSKNPLADTSYNSFTSVAAVDAFPLNTFRDGGAGVVAESGDAYICWQIYTPHSVNINMYMKSAMVNESQDTLNWFFTVDQKNYGYNGTDVFDYETNSSKCTAVIASFDQYGVGVSGSKVFTISTQPLDPSAVGKPYSAFLYAEICTK